MSRHGMNHVGVVVSMCLVPFVSLLARAVAAGSASELPWQAEPTAAPGIAATIRHETDIKNRRELFLISADEKFIWTEEMLVPPKELENAARRLVFQTDQKLAPSCQTREVVRVIREWPVLIEVGPGYRLLHHLERWDLTSCGQLMSYLAWYTLDDFYQKQSPRIITGAPRIITGPLAEAEEFAVKQPALRVLLDYKPH